MPPGCAGAFATLRATVQADGRHTRDSLDAIFKMLNGNGQPGLVQDMAQMKAHTEENTHARHEVAQHERSAAHSRTWAIIGAVVALAVGGATVIATLIP